jgi:hypothetical protein
MLEKAVRSAPLREGVFSKKINVGFDEHFTVNVVVNKQGRKSLRVPLVHSTVSPGKFLRVFKEGLSKGRHGARPLKQGEPEPLSGRNIFAVSYHGLGNNRTLNNAHAVRPDQIQGIIVEARNAKTPERARQLARKIGNQFGKRVTEINQRRAKIRRR